MDLAAVIQDAVRRALPGNSGRTNNEGQPDAGSLQLAAAGGATPAAPVLLLQMPTGSHSAANGQPPANAAAGNANEQQQQNAGTPDPFAVACARLGITSVDQLESVKRDADAYAAEAQSDLSKAAIRRYGQDKGPGMAEGYKHLTLAHKKEMASTWNTEADERMNITGDHGADRQAQPRNLGSAANAEGSGNPNDNRPAWERLSDEQRERANHMGITTPEKREEYAQNLLKQTGSASN